MTDRRLRHQRSVELGIMNTQVAKTLTWMLQETRAIMWRSFKKVAIIPSYETAQDQMKDNIAPFDEYPPCDLCGSTSTTEKLITRSGHRIVECDTCKLWFTSPRINEHVWMDWLKQTSDRSVEFTENRLKYGVALSSNKKYVRPGWRERRLKAETRLLANLETLTNHKIGRLHDVGCGVGFLMQAAQTMGMAVTGNELNGYACQVMRERLNLTVFNDILPNLNIENSSVDAVIMRDYLEHTYHPFVDLKAAYGYLRPGGALYIETFHIDCQQFDKQRENWNMLFWNHAFHFSTAALTSMIEKAGFKIVKVDTSYTNSLIEVYAKKE